MMAGVVSGITADTVDALLAAGISATADPRNAHPPCALVIMRSLRPRTRSLVRAELVTLLIPPGIGNADALQWLDEAMTAVWRVAPVRQTATLSMWTSPHTGMDLLCYELSPITCDFQYEEEVTPHGRDIGTVRAGNSHSG